MAGNHCIIDGTDEDISQFLNYLIVLNNEYPTEGSSDLLTQTGKGKSLLTGFLAELCFGVGTDDGPT
jgi:hypothetical protein